MEIYVCGNSHYKDDHAFKSVCTEEDSIAASMMDQNESECMQTKMELNAKAGDDMHGDEGIVPALGMPIVDVWDIESLQEEEPQLDIDDVMQANVMKAMARVHAMQYGHKDVKLPMVEAQDGLDVNIQVEYALEEHVFDEQKDNMPMSLFIPLDEDVIHAWLEQLDDGHNYMVSKTIEMEKVIADTWGVGIHDAIMFDEQEQLEPMYDGLYGGLSCVPLEEPPGELGVNLMIKQGCSYVLMDMLLHVAILHVMHVKWSLVEAFFGQCFAKGEVECNTFSNEPEQEQLQMWYGSQKPLVFVQGGLDCSMYMSSWATTLWPFDPGG